MSEAETWTEWGNRLVTPSQSDSAAFSRVLGGTVCCCLCLYCCVPTVLHGWSFLTHLWISILAVGPEASGESDKAFECHPGSEGERHSPDSTSAGVWQHCQQSEQHWTRTGGRISQTFPRISVPVAKSTQNLDLKCLCGAFVVVRTCTSAVRRWDLHCSDWLVIRRTMTKLWVSREFFSHSFFYLASNIKLMD